MRVLFYSCVECPITAGDHADRFERISKILKSHYEKLISSQSYNFDYILNVGNDSIVKWKIKLYPYSKNIIFKKHCDFEYYKKYKHSKNLIWHSKLFIACEQIKHYDICVHVDYDFLLMTDLKWIFEKSKTCDAIAFINRDDYSKLDIKRRIGSEIFICFNDSITDYYRVYDNNTDDSISEEHLINNCNLNILNLHEFITIESVIQSIDNGGLPPYVHLNYGSIRFQSELSKANKQSEAMTFVFMFALDYISCCRAMNMDIAYNIYYKPYSVIYNSAKHKHEIALKNVGICEYREYVDVFNKIIEFTCKQFNLEYVKVE